MLILIDHLRAEHIANNIENMDSFGIVDDGEVGARGGGLNQRRDTADGIGVKSISLALRTFLPVR